MNRQIRKGLLMPLQPGPNRNQGRLVYYAAACGQDSQVNFTAVRPRIKCKRNHRLPARESYFTVTVLYRTDWIGVRTAPFVDMGHHGRHRCEPALRVQCGVWGTRSEEGAGQLSGFIQGTGYLVAGAGPLLVGYLHTTTWELDWRLGGAVPIYRFTAYISRDHRRDGSTPNQHRRRGGSHSVTSTFGHGPLGN